MRCPKCGSFLGEGTTVCFMCGTNVKTYNPNQQNNGGMYFNGGGYQQPPQKPNAFAGLNDYDKIYNNVKKGDKDVFDFFADHKMLISFLSFLFTVAIIAGAGLIYYKVRTKEVKLTPVVGQLYYSVSDVLQKVGDNEYTKSGNKGSDCGIVLAAGTDISNNHVDALFDGIKNSLSPERDNKLAILNDLDIFTTQEGSVTINGNSWHYMNVFYPEKSRGNPTILKHRILTIVKNGYSYDIQLTNNANDSTCSAALDDFARSLQFLETMAKTKK